MSEVPCATAALSYEELVNCRKECTFCAPVLVNPARYDLAKFDSNEIGPWSLWLSARPAKILIVGQDWGNLKLYKKNMGRDTDANLTNRRLRLLLKEIGIDVPKADDICDHNYPVFLTNSILCLKQGETMSSPVEDRFFKNCASFLKKTAAFAAAPVAICLGARAYPALARSFGRNPLPFREAVASAQPIQLPDGPLTFAAYHPAARAVNRTWSQQLNDWKRIANELSLRGYVLSDSEQLPSSEQR